jgi:hypothetical protein
MHMLKYCGKIFHLVLEVHALDIVDDVIVHQSPQLLIWYTEQLEEQRQKPGACVRSTVVCKLHIHIHTLSLMSALLLSVCVLDMVSLLLFIVQGRKEHKGAESRM